MYEITITRQTEVGKDEVFLSLQTEEDIPDHLHRFNVAMAALAGLVDCRAAPDAEYENEACAIAEAINLGHVVVASDHAVAIGFGNHRLHGRPRAPRRWNKCRPGRRRLV